MIAYLHGKVKSREVATLVVDVNGIGYEVQLTPTAADTVTIGSEIELYIAEHIKEDHYSLFGFLTPLERSVYHQLTSVSGVGPKAAMAVLAAHTPQEVEAAIINDKVEVFSAISGLGKKTAQRIILELKGKLVEPAVKTALQTDQAYVALLSLGYPAHQAKVMLSGVDSDLPLEARVKAALQGDSK